MRSGSLCYVLYIDQNEHFSARIEDGRYLSGHGNKCFIEHEQAAFEINKNYVFPDLNKALEYLVEIILVKESLDYILYNIMLNNNEGNVK